MYSFVDGCENKNKASRFSYRLGRIYLMKLINFSHRYISSTSKKIYTFVESIIQPDNSKTFIK